MLGIGIKIMSEISNDIVNYGVDILNKVIALSGNCNFLLNAFYQIILAK